MNISIGEKTQCIAITPDGRKSIIGNLTGNVQLIDLLTSKVATVSSNISTPYSLAVASSGAVSYLADFTNKDIVIVSHATPSFGGSVTVPGCPNSLVITANDTSIYATDGSSNQIFMVDPIMGMFNGSITLTGSSNASSIQITPDGQRAYVLCDEATVIKSFPLYTTLTVDKTILLPQAVASLGMLAISPDGTKVFAISGSTLYKIDLAHQDQLSYVELPGYLTSLGITPDSQTVIVMSQDNKMVFVDAQHLRVTSKTVAAKGVLIISPDPAPVARFTSSAQTKLKQIFDASGSISAVGSIKTYQWDFGDGSKVISTERAKIQHTYKTPGQYVVTLTVTNTAGTSTKQVSTGQVVHQQGGPQATVSKSITVSSAVKT